MSIAKKYFIALILCGSLISTLLGLLPIEVVLLLAAFAATLSIYPALIEKRKIATGVFVWFCIVFLGLAIGLFRPEGFSYPLILDAVSLHEGGEPFSLYLNMGKAIAGYMVLGFLLAMPLVSRPYISSAVAKLLAFILLPASVLVLAYCVLGLSVQVKSINYIVVFGVINLFSTCVSEEAFMRLIFQREIGRFCSFFNQNPMVKEGIPLLLTTLLFVATHIGPSLEITAVYALAGFFYGLIYMLTKNLCYSIACHFTINIVHFGVLTYPIA